MDELSTLAQKCFRLGPNRPSVSDFISIEQLQKLKKESDALSNSTVVSVAIEVIRNLYLAAHAPDSLFFPGDILMDRLWHNLVLESAAYREFCEKIKPGCFLEHRSVTFADYLTELSPERVHQEQCSWLVSYIHNFGPIEPQAFAHLNLAKSLCAKIESDLNGLNQLGAALLASAGEAKHEFDFDRLIEELREKAEILAEDPTEVAKYVRAIIAGLSEQNESGAVLLSISQYENLYSVSTALAFTIAQHLHAVDRLLGVSDWQARQPELWQDISSGKKLCGLATTNIAKPGGSPIKGTKLENQYLVTGTAQWVCGLGLFDYVLVAFAASPEVVFAVVEAPKNDFVNSTTKGHRKQLSCLMGAGTYELEFDNAVVPFASVVQAVVPKGPAMPRPSRYVIPELGIGKGALKAIRDLVSESSHPRLQLIRDHLKSLGERLAKIEEARAAQTDMNELVILRDDFNRDCLRILTFAYGSKALEKNHFVGRLQIESLLLDTVIQSIPVITQKLARTSAGV